MDAEFGSWRNGKHSLDNATPPLFARRILVTLRRDPLPAAIQFELATKGRAALNTAGFLPL